MALDATELRVTESLISKTGDENPFERTRPPFEFRQSVFVGIVPIFLPTDGRLDLIASVDDRLEHVDEVAPLVTNRVSEFRDVFTVAVAVTPDDVRRDVPSTDDVRIQTRKVEFVNILMEADLGGKDEATAVGVVERPHRFVELVSPGIPRDENTAVVGLTDLNRREYVPDRRPCQLLDRFFRTRDKIENAIEVRFSVEERIRLINDRSAGHVVPRR